MEYACIIWQTFGPQEALTTVPATYSKRFLTLEASSVWYKDLWDEVASVGSGCWICHQFTSSLVKTNSLRMASNVFYNVK